MADDDHAELRQFVDLYNAAAERDSDLMYTVGWLWRVQDFPLLAAIKLARALPREAATFQADLEGTLRDLKFSPKRTKDHAHPDG